MSRFERYLTLWVALCIVVGVALGHVAPGVFHAIGAIEIGKVNLTVAVLIWFMIIPMLIKIDFTALGEVRQHWRGIGVTLLINWAVKPFSMAALAWLFVGTLFRPYLPPDQINSYIAGLIILAAAPCTAMVFVWSNLTKGEPHFTLSQVALNDTIMVFAFAPIVGLLLGLSAITVPWHTLILSVVLYIILPVIAAQLLRRTLLARGGDALSRFLGVLQPLSLIALLATLVLLFGFQGEQIIKQPGVIALLAVPILIQVYLNTGLAYALNRLTGERHCIAGPSALIGASNFFELAVAAAISLFGFNSGAALATVVGVLVEVPAMLTVVAIVNRSKGWYERGKPASWSRSVGVLDLLTSPNLDPNAFEPIDLRALHAPPATHRPRILLLYGSLRERSFSRLLTLEAARILEAFGAETRVFDPVNLPLADAAAVEHPKVQELRDLFTWSEGQVWTSPERHGAMTGVFKTQIDWIPLALGSVRPSQGRTLAVMQVSGGSQSFNAVNQLRVLGRWMRMITIPNQSSVAKAFQEFDDNDRMKPSPYYDRVVDVMEELVKFTLLTRGASAYLTDRYSERKETAEQLSARVNMRAI